MLTIQERLDQILRRVQGAAPWASLLGARGGLEQIIKDVEDEFSGIPENPDSTTAGTDGRIYPPHDQFEIPSDSPRIRTFKQRRHRTSFGDNGAIRISRPDGSIVLDLAGADGKTIGALVQEESNELN